MGNKEKNIKITAVVTEVDEKNKLKVVAKGDTTIDKTGKEKEQDDLRV